MKTSRLDSLIIKGLTMSAGLLAAPHALPQSHEIAVTLARPQAVTEIVLPALGDHPVYAARQLESRRESDGQYCRYVYADGSHEILDKVCSEKPTPLFVRYNCREWTAVSIADGSLAVRPKTLRTTFGDDGKMFAELDLTGSELTVSLFLVGDRIGTTTCSIWHPFEESIVYAVEIHVEGGKVSATADLAPVSNARVSVDSLDDIRVDLAGATLRIDTLSNNQIDAALLGGLATLAPLPGVVPLVAAGAYALLEDIDVANLALLHEIGAAVHGTLWGGCDDRDDCLARIAEGVIAKLDEPIVDAINDALDKPLEFERTVRTGFSAFDIANSVGTEITAELASLSTSSSENALTTFWDVAVTNLALGTCAGGITGYTAPSPVLDAVADGDITVAVPFSLVGDAVARVLPQLDLCRTPFSFAGFTGSFAPNGNVAVARGGPRKLRLAVPLRCNATAPARGRYTFDAVLEAHPELGRAGEIELVLDRASITNLAGQIVVPLTGKTQARYVFGTTGACVSVNGGPCVDAPDFGPALEAAANAALAPLFPRTLVQRSTLYVAPHVYLREQDIAVADTSFALGATIVDGSRPVDLAVARFEAAGPSTDSASAFGTLREIPLAVVVKNRDPWYASAPVDVSLQAGTLAEVRWLPPLAPGEEYTLPLTVWAYVDARGSVTLAPTVVAHIDPNGGTGERISDDVASTTVDPNRGNNRREITLDNAWFRPDYLVDITDLRATLATVEHGTTVTSSEITGGRFVVTARVRNIGGGDAASDSLRSLAFSVNGITYATRFVSALRSAESAEIEATLDVDEGPNHYPCAYDVRAELGPGDTKPGNDGHTVSVAVSSSGCLDGGATESDLAQVEAIADDFLDARFSGSETLQWGTDNRGHADGGLNPGTSNAPILDHVDP